MDTITLVAAIIAAVASLAGATLTPWLAYRAARLGVYAQTRSINRKTWMNRVIENVRDLVVLCRHKPGDSEGLTRLTTELDLLLNPEDGESKTAQVINACQTLLKTLEELRALRTEDDWRRYSELVNENLVRPVKIVLAHEWKLVMEQK